jgi:RNA polymerase sigma-70 factor (ECF subfamily)
LVRLPEPPTDPKLYVFRSVRNSAIDLLKARARRREERLAVDWDAAATPADASSAELSGLVAEALQRLAGESREVIELHLHAALTFQEISQMLDEPLPTVTARYYRALEKLGQEIRVRHE